MTSGRLDGLDGASHNGAMVDEPVKKKPGPAERAEAAQRERAARLAGALRANLRRRRAPDRSVGSTESVEGPDVSNEKEPESHG